MSTLANLITQHAAVEAASEDWAAVAAIVRGLGLRQPARLCYSVESGDAIEAVGEDQPTVTGAMLLDPNGMMLFQKLSSSAGVMWAHPKTQQWLAWFVAQGRISQAGADALTNLSAPLIHADVTAEDCQKAAIVVACRASVSAIASKVSNINAWLDALDLATKTPEELQTYCNSLLESETGNP